MRFLVRRVCGMARIIKQVWMKGTHTTRHLRLAIWAYLDLGSVVQADSTSSRDIVLGVGTRATTMVIVGLARWPSCRHCPYRAYRTCLPRSTNSRPLFRAGLVAV